MDDLCIQQIGRYTNSIRMPVVVLKIAGQIGYLPKNFWLYTVNDLINTHSQINASYPINAPLRCKLRIRCSPLIDAHPRIASKTKETLYRVESRNVFSFLLGWLTMTGELHLVQSSQLWGICVHCQSLGIGHSLPHTSISNYEWHL